MVGQETNAEWPIPASFELLTENHASRGRAFIAQLRLLIWGIRLRDSTRQWHRHCRRVGDC
jgi:hypothetical protein